MMKSLRKERVSMTEKWSDNPRIRAVEENLKRIRHQVAEAALRAGRDPQEIVLMGATKTVPPEIINFAISRGLTHIGENRVQEMLSKLPDLELGTARLHFIGHLQSNKVRKLIPTVSMIQSVDSPKLAETIARISLEASTVTDVLIEVNIGGEESKAGIHPDAAAEFAAQIGELPGIRLRGLMAIPPICENSAQIRNYFSEIYKLFIDIRAKKSDNSHMNVLSMGMSGDFADAISEGSTMIRVGSALFGSRIGAAGV